MSARTPSQNEKETNRSYEQRERIKNRIGSIEHRPVEVKKRERIGDWEVDTIIGRKQQQAIVTMVEREPDTRSWPRWSDGRQRQ